MVIQHNIPALNALRNKSINNANTAQNLEKLSSGYRINRAADDAAGLAISEKMRGQIRGLAMASQNTNDAISLIQTAEGGLNEIHAILHRMRELAVQAANGTYDSMDREQINSEVDALKSEIDRISSATHYNGINLLDGTLGGNAAKYIPGNDPDYVMGSYPALARALNSMGFQVNAAGSPSTVSGQLSITSYNSAFDSEKAKLIVTSGDFFSATNPPMLALQVGDTAYFGQRVSSPNLTYPDVNGDPQALTDGTYAFFDSDGNVVAAVYNGGQPISDFQLSGAVSGIPMPDAGDTNELFEAPVPDGTVAIPDGDPAFNLFVGTEKDKLEFQIGANGYMDQIVGIHVENMSSANLGTRSITKYNNSGTIMHISVINNEYANDAINIIDAAVNQVSAARSDLGSLQNRLEHTRNNLGVTRENLQAAESVIRDVDMAKEMMDLQKNQILVEASQAMLAQANQLPQGILELLR